MGCPSKAVSAVTSFSTLASFRSLLLPETLLFAILFMTAYCSTLRSYYSLSRRGIFEWSIDWLISQNGQLNGKTSVKSKLWSPSPSETQTQISLNLSSARRSLLSTAAVDRRGGCCCGESEWLLARESQGQTCKRSLIFWSRSKIKIIGGEDQDHS